MEKKKKPPKPPPNHFSLRWPGNGKPSGQGHMPRATLCPASGVRERKHDTPWRTRVTEGIPSLLVTVRFFFFSLFFLKFSHHERYIYSFDLGEKRNVKIGVSFPGNIQSKDSFSLDPDCAAGSFIDIPT